MLTNLKAVVLPAAAAIGLFGTGAAAKADTWEHIDELALRLQHQAQELHDEAHAHFRHTPVYRAMDNNIDQMEKLAAHIHGLAHTGASIPHLSQDVRTLDRLYHNTEHLLVTLGRWGQVDPVAYRHLRDGLAAMGQTLHHLRRDLRELEHGFYHTAPYHGPVTQPYPGPVISPQPGPVFTPPAGPVIQPFPQVQPTNRGRTIHFRIGLGRR
ncbi:MAG TPA: hypothetical protein VIL46_17630 [Gemmataceae bacterium]